MSVSLGLDVSVGVILRQKATDNGVGVVFDEGLGRKTIIYRKSYLLSETKIP